MKSHKKRKSSKFNPVKQIKKAKHEYCFLHYCIVRLKWLSAGTVSLMMKKNVNILRSRYVSREHFRHK